MLYYVCLEEFNVQNTHNRVVA